ncbi:hypothetical protein HDU97_006798 [Phlyctochytrium planicorne]|nr:hypothetical protein HDU97_006798 [Phlyctochytrium planicorne]
MEREFTVLKKKSDDDFEAGYGGLRRPGKKERRVKEAKRKNAVEPVKTVMVVGVPSTQQREVKSGGSETPIGSKASVAVATPPVAPAVESGSGPVGNGGSRPQSVWERGVPKGVNAATASVSVARGNTTKSALKPYSVNAADCAPPKAVYRPVCQQQPTARTAASRPIPVSINYPVDRPKNISPAKLGCASVPAQRHVPMSVNFDPARAAQRQQQVQQQLQQQQQKRVPTWSKIAAPPCPHGASCGNSGCQLWHPEKVVVTAAIKKKEGFTYVQTKSGKMWVKR